VSVFSQEAVDAVAASHVAGLRVACADDLPRARQHTFKLLFEVAPDGKVIDATAAGGGSAERPLRECIEKHLGAWKFPPPGAKQTVSATLVLSED
jgi:hypothetical protein